MFRFKIIFTQLSWILVDNFFKIPTEVKKFVNLILDIFLFFLRRFIEFALVKIQLLRCYWNINWNIFKNWNILSLDIFWFTCIVLFACIVIFRALILFLAGISIFSPLSKIRFYSILELTIQLFTSLLVQVSNRFLPNHLF